MPETPTLLTAENVATLRVLLDAATVDMGVWTEVACCLEGVGIADPETALETLRAALPAAVHQ